MFQCTNSAQEHSSSDTSDRKQTADGQQTEIFLQHLTSVIFWCVGRRDIINKKNVYKWGTGKNALPVGSRYMSARF